jgi:ABC-type glycerol-3-phosphate transport system permease component
MRKTNFWSWVLYALAIVITLLNLAPLVWIALSSFKRRIDIFSMPPVWIPPTWNFDNYTMLLRDHGHELVNTAVLTVASLLGSLALALPAAFALAVFRFKRKKDLEMWFLSARMMPPVAAAIPLYLTLRSLHLLDTWLGLIIVYMSVGIPLVVWLTTPFMRGISYEIIEAALIDGCTWPQIFLRIMLPLSSGGIATAAIFNAIFAWNELLLPLFLTNRDAQTFSVVLTSFQGQTEINWELMCAGAVIQVFPIVFITFVAQRYIVSGLTLGSVKG